MADTHAEQLGHMRGIAESLERWLASQSQELGTLAKAQSDQAAQLAVIHDQHARCPHILRGMSGREVTAMILSAIAIGVALLGVFWR